MKNIIAFIAGFVTILTMIIFNVPEPIIIGAALAPSVITLLRVAYLKHNYRKAMKHAEQIDMRINNG